MAETTKIEWAHSTFNPFIGCTKVSPGCANCYAEIAYVTKMQGVQWGAGQPRRRTSVGNWKKPLTWNRKALKSGEPWRVFCASLADVFDDEVEDSWRDDLFELIEATPALTWMLLTKRPENMTAGGLAPNAWRDVWPANVWVMTTVEDQERADERLPLLFEVPAVVRGVSYEPALGPVNFSEFFGWCPHQAEARDRREIEEHRERLRGDIPNCVAGCQGQQAISWLIAGGESKSKARPSHPDWFRWARDAAAAAGVPFLFKQWGEWLAGEVYAEGDALGLVRYQDGATHDEHPSSLKHPDHWWSGDVHGGELSSWVGKAAAGRMLDGREHDAVPMAV